MRQALICAALCGALAVVWFLQQNQNAAMENRLAGLEARLAKSEKQAHDASQHAYELEQQLDAMRRQGASWPPLQVRPPGAAPRQRAKNLENTLRSLDPSTVATLIRVLSLL